MSPALPPLPPVPVAGGFGVGEVSAPATAPLLFGVGVAVGGCVGGACVGGTEVAVGGGGVGVAVGGTWKQLVMQPGSLRTLVKVRVTVWPPAGVVV